MGCIIFRKPNVTRQLSSLPAVQRIRNDIYSGCVSLLPGQHTFQTAEHEFEALNH